MSYKSYHVKSALNTLKDYVDLKGVLCDRVLLDDILKEDILNKDKNSINIYDELEVFGIDCKDSKLCRFCEKNSDE